MNVSATSSSTYAYGSYAASGSARTSKSKNEESAGTGTKTLSPEEQKQLEKLQARDREVSQHELAHMSVAGGLAVSGPSYTYQQGPDGRNYAVGGEVGIDVSPGRTPEETIRKATQIQAAALAPASPSGQDRAVAAQAASMAQQARAEEAQQTQTTSSANNAQGNNKGDTTTRDRRSDIQSAYGSGTTPSGQLIQAYA